MITWKSLMDDIVRHLIGETSASVADEVLMAAMNAALLAVYGDLVVVVEPATISMTTGTSEYDVPDKFLYIQAVWDANGRQLPDYAWDIRAGVSGGTTEPQLCFRPPFFTPTTSQNPVIAGWEANTVKPASGANKATITADTDIIQIEPGWLIQACLSALHAALGGTASDLSDWHKLESAETRLDQKAERRLRDELVPTIPPKYRPTPGARIVPGRAQ